MPHLLAALFDDYGRAQRALEALMEDGVAQDRIALIGTPEGREVSSISGFRELSARDDTLAELHDLPLPDEDMRLFEKGLQRGCTLIAARLERSKMDEAVRIIEFFDPVDLDRRSAEWPTEEGARRSADAGAPLGAGMTAGTGGGATNTGAQPGMGLVADSSHDIGASELRTDETPEPAMGSSSTTATGGRREDDRADRPGVLELGAQEDARLASKQAPGAEQTAGIGLNAKPDLYRRETNRIGRVRAYSQE